MNPTLEENQNGQPQNEQPKEGIVSRGINSLNNLRGANRLAANPINKVTSTVAKQVGKGFIKFLATNPWVWGAVGIAFLGIAVFAIVFSGASGGVPGAPTQEQNNQAISPSPTMEIAPTITLIETATITPPAGL